MKMHAAVYWRITMSLATAVVYVGIPWNLAVADGTLPSSTPATVPTPQAAPAATVDARAPALPVGVSEVVKLYQGGLSKEFIVGYIENSVLPFHLTAEGAIYLQHLGVSQEVISALIHRDGELQRQSAAAYQQQQQAAANNQDLAGNPAPSVVIPVTPPPEVPYAYQDASAPVVYRDYAVYPYYGYDYPYFYGSEVLIGGGFGFRHRSGFGSGFGGRGGRDGGARGGFGERGGVGRGGFSGGHGGGHR